MSEYTDTFKFTASPKTKKENTVICRGTRFSVLTASLLRVENQVSSVFCDEPTQSVWFRDFDSPEFTAVLSGDELSIKTTAAEFVYSLSAQKMIKIVLPTLGCVTNFRKGNLSGTCRTLDNTNGKTSLEDGIISKNGVAVLDDSDSLILTKDAAIIPRKAKEKDLYYFAYERNYTDAVRDFFKLTGFPPLVPRFALGNWWSRYKTYTQDEYITLMQRFIDERIPVTVATVDMDWHWVKVVEKFGKDSIDVRPKDNLRHLFYTYMSPGWTGYSWNTDLFPDPKGFLSWLKEHNYKVTMNLHPASGCKFYEDAYSDFCDFMGVDKNSKKQICFDITDKKFIEGYFRFLHHPHEKDGVDFWWIDWQQGKNTNIPGLDPLWALNHYHSLDVARDGKRPLILSRFAGAGSHRYPLGFSGDTAQTWNTLAFQPYFTSTASNIGYTWWSHDIGGHHFGIRDDELYLRWVQFGIFSPVNRLHSTSNEFMGKEPWKYRSSVRSIAAEALRFRHRMLPYLYTMNHRTAAFGRALIEPMYYSAPYTEQSYCVPNEYNFGSEITVCAITEKMNPQTNLAKVKVWLPEGRFTDIFSDRIYTGGKTIDMYRDEGGIPVLAHEGSIIPLSLDGFGNNTENPEAMEILAFRGNGSFSMYEDAGETLAYQNGHSAETLYEISEAGSKITFVINAAAGDLSIIPSKRSYKIRFDDISAAESVQVKINGKFAAHRVSVENCRLCVYLTDISSDTGAEIILNGISARVCAEKKEQLISLFSRLQGQNMPKAAKYTGFVLKGTKTIVPDALKGAISETDSLYYGDFN